jgi:hypothetical protein
MIAWIATFFTGIFGKVWAWLAAVGVLFAAIGSVFLYGRSKGKAFAEATAEAAKVKVDNAALQESLDAAKERNDVEIEVTTLPDGDAAKRLRDDGWQRD